MSNTSADVKTRAVPVNYWFCSFWLISASWLSFEYTLLLKAGTRYEHALIYFNCLLLAALLPLAVGYWYVRGTSLFGRKTMSLLISVMAGVLVLIWIDLQLYSLLQIHVWRTIRIVYGGDYRTFVQTLSSSQVRQSSIALVSSLPLVAAIAVQVLFRLTSHLCNIAPMSISAAMLKRGLLVCGLMAVTLPLVSLRTIRPEIKRTARAALPLGFAHFVKPSGTMIFDFSIPARRNTEKGGAMFDSGRRRAERLPNVVVFVVESLRADAVSSSLTPNLAALREHCVKVEKAISCGNATQLGWFSILTGASPLRFADVSKNEALWGSEPFKLLKAAEYSIHAIASFGLDFYQLDQIAFGKHRELADSVRDLPTYIGVADPFEADPAKVDVKLTSDVIEILTNATNSTLLLVFYNSTHHPYSFPDAYAGPFGDALEPPGSIFPHSSFGKDPMQVERVRNRYLTSVHFVDSQIGRVIESLKLSGQFNNTLLAVVADHGEEFMEFGHMFHNSDLNRCQIEIPFLIKLPGSSMAPDPANVACSMDLLPTILDAVGIPESEWQNMDGRSILTGEPGVAVSAAANGNRDPNTFCLDDGQLQTHFAFDLFDAAMWTRRSVWVSKMISAHENSNGKGERDGTIVKELTKRTKEWLLLR